MTTIQITLPDELAQQAEEAGLLSTESLEQLLRQRLKAQSFAQLHAAMDRMSAQPDPEPMSMEEIVEEVRAVRAERRAGILA